MARGWESKSVEAQQEEAGVKRGGRPQPMTSEEAVRHREVEGLRLSRQRMVEQLAASRDTRHRKMLADALNDLEQKIHSLER